MDSYGKEVILDLHDCNSSHFNRKKLKEFFTELCNLINMEQCKLAWWDDLYTPNDEKETDPHLVGTSAVQFILTSNITIHTLDILERVYLNVFSCKEFDEKVVREFSKKFFEGRIVNFRVFKRI